jgi:hypothetical protein
LPVPTLLSPELLASDPPSPPLDPAAASSWPEPLSPETEPPLDPDPDELALDPWLEPEPEPLEVAMPLDPEVEPEPPPLLLEAEPGFSGCWEPQATRSPRAVSQWTGRILQPGNGRQEPKASAARPRR